MPTTGPPVARRRLGEVLAGYRKATGKTQEQVAAAMDWGDDSKISRVELGKTGLHPGQLRDLLAYYNITDPDEIETLVEIANRGKTTRRKDARSTAELLAVPFKGVSTLVGYEMSAVRMDTICMHLVPGLLQIPAYARAHIETENPEAPYSEVEAKVLLKSARSEVLFREDPAPLVLRCVIDEPVLWRAIAAPAVMVEQLAYLIKASEWDNVKVRVRGRDSGHVGMLPSCSTLWLRDAAPVVYEEGLHPRFPRRDMISRYTLAFDRVWAAALPVGATVGLIEKALAYHDKHQ